MKNRLLLLLFSLSFGLNAQMLNIHVYNPSTLSRQAETVEIDWKNISKKLQLKKVDKVIVVDSKGVEYPSQKLYEGEKVPQKLIFQLSLSAKQTAMVMIKKGIPQTYESKTFGRFVPERKDDYAWENDRVAFRIYGPALIKSDGPSNGFDVWCKRTDHLIINNRYEKELSGKGSYHIDWGDGLDMYKVGRTLGAGAMAPFVNDTLALASNFVSQETLDNGPIRTTFRVKYASFPVNGESVTETRTISIDAGSQLSKVTEEYTGFKKETTVAAGIVKRTGNDSTYTDKSKYYAIYKEPSSEKDGTISLAVVKTTGWNEFKTTTKHTLAFSSYKPGSRFVYYAGYGWSKWGFPTLESWKNYIDKFVILKKNPLIVSIK